MPTTVQQHTNEPTRPRLTGQRPTSSVQPGRVTAHDAPPIELDVAALVEQLDCVIPEAVLPELVADSKEQAIRALVGSLVEAGAIAERQQDDILTSILRRERLVSTGIGRGVAIPHTKHESVGRPMAAVAYSRKGIEFDSLDGQPVHLIFLLVSPTSSSSDHLVALEAISRTVADLRWAGAQESSGDSG